jgi:hypothetical protein
VTLQERPHVVQGTIPASTREAERRAFIHGVVSDFAALRADPKAWAEELAEREAWNATNSDGLEDE